LRFSSVKFDPTLITQCSNRPKVCSLCAKMRQVMMVHLNGQGSDHVPGSTPEKITRSMVCGIAPSRGVVAPHPRVVTRSYSFLPCKLAPSLSRHTMSGLNARSSSGIKMAGLRDFMERKSPEIILSLDFLCLLYSHDTFVSGS
jgi:hypothetical protein